MIFIYNGNLDYIVTLNGELSEFKKSPNSWYPNWMDSYYATDRKIENPKVENGMIMEKTRLEMILDGTIEAMDGEYVNENGELVFIPKDTNFLKPVWNKDKNIWEEGATPEEIQEVEFKKSVDFYNKELEFANKAHTEFEFGIIDEPSYLGVKEYIIAIDPYAQAKMTAKEMKKMSLRVINRPSIFDRYN